jgi:quinolinate synthase
MVCPNMKKTSLERVYLSLRDMQYKMELDKEVILKAKACLNRMFSVS